MKKQICLNKSVLDFMASKLTPEALVFEFGGGWSSKWFANRCGQLLVVETSFKWADTIRKELRGNGRVVVPRVGSRYFKDLNRLLRGVEKADLILIDCVENIRYAATHFAWPLVKPGGWLLFDDAQRPRHADVVSWMHERGENATRLTWQPGDVESAKERLTLAWRKK